MKKDYTPEKYIEMYFKTQKKFIHRKQSEAGLTLFTEQKFKVIIDSLATTKYGENYTTAQAKKAITSYLNTRTFKSEAELLHSNLMKKLKEEGVVSRIYRMGGKTSMKASSYTKRYEERDFNGDEYHSNGYYRMGSILVKFWSSNDNSQVGFLELIPMMGKSYIKSLRGEQIEF